jgi:para-aminobenzoate synthetase/4-amino-4-deoxychorismate lyase
MQVILDELGGRRVFCQPCARITAETAAEVPAALAALEAALAAGRHVAGWLGYELGHALEARFLRSPSAFAGPRASYGISPASASRAGQGRLPLLHLGVFDAPATEAPPPTGRAWVGPLTPEWDADAYAARFARVKDYIAAGDIYQANLSFRARFAVVGDARALYETLRAAAAAPHCAYVDDGSRQIVSLSPELFFEIARDGMITARPMKGTAPREGDDDAGRAALAASDKNRAENLMIVDLLRNDLSRIAAPGSVAVRDLFKVETYPTLHTMVSTVTAKVRAGTTPADILRALFPCGSVTGAPKIRAMEILHELEASPRGAYCGAVGYFAPDGSARFNVAIRTLTILGGQGELGIGGGVVQDSDAAGEYAECLLKARFFDSARRPLELIETLRHDNGFVRLDNHLARLEKSAAAFGIAFDATVTRAALEAAISGVPGPLRVRLALDQGGVPHVTTAPLPPNPPLWRFAISPHAVQSGDVLQQHKTSWRDLYDDESARLGTDEVVFLNERGEVAEGARSNIFVKRGDMLLTPALSAGVLPGILRAELLASGQACEATLMPDDLKGDLYFGNSLRGLITALPLA